MRRVVASLCLLECLLQASAQCSAPASEFQLDGDYLIGGLFDVHHVSGPVSHDRPEAMDCSRQPLILSSYRRFQLMRFSVEEINNSTRLLPNVSLGYRILDHCSDTHNFPGVFNLVSVNGSIQPWREPRQNPAQVVAVVGTFTSTETLTVAPLLMMDLIPMVSYGAASSIFSRKQNFPSFLRTVHPNKDVMEVIITIVQHFNWRWVAFLNIDNDYGNDGLEWFIKMIKDTEICLAYTRGLNHYTDYSEIFKQIEQQRVHVVIVFAAEWTAEVLIESAIRDNVTNKVWIAGDAWSLNKRLPKHEGIQSIGTVLGVSEPAVTVPGFTEFIIATKSKSHCDDEGETFCNQVCNCSSLSPKDIIDAEPSFNFPVYSAVYAIAHALHNALQCEAGRCDRSTNLHPHMVLSELKRSYFRLLNRNFQFDENGDPKYGSYSIVFWNNSGDAEEIGFYKFRPMFDFYINASKIQWYTKGKVPTSVCSQECPAGYAKKQDGIHNCCFTCEVCLNGTYANVTADPFKCFTCEETEWSAVASTSCNLRVVEYVSFTGTGAILIMVGACTLVVLSLGVSLLFAVNYQTPVVRSAGGPMCFLVLGCLSVSSVSVFFYFGKPTVSSCALRFVPFILFFTACLACFVVRSFQIVCIFKMAAKFPQLYSWWMKYHGQWLVITVAFLTQGLLLQISHYFSPARPYNDTFCYPDKIILTCDINVKALSAPVILTVSLGCLCFIFSYMGKDLPKNYNEAKAITFCLLLLILTWIIFASELLLYQSKSIHSLNALAVLFSLYCFLLWYFLPKCYIIIFQPHKNTQQYFQGLIQNYTKTISQ
ncbi:taste receptor type 1 member 2.2 [Aulostomus maculatus]